MKSFWEGFGAALPLGIFMGSCFCLLILQYFNAIGCHQ